MTVCTKCGGSVDHTEYAAEVRKRMDAGIGDTARLFNGSNGAKLGVSFGAGQIALVGFTADLSDFSEVRLKPYTAFDLATWLTDAAEVSERDGMEMLGRRERRRALRGGT